MEVVLFWDVPTVEAPRFVGALRTDLAALEADEFLERWRERQLGRRPAVTDRELLRVGRGLPYRMAVARERRSRHREPDVRWVVRKRDASLLFPRLARRRDRPRDR